MALTIEELKELIQADEHRQLELKKTTGELKDGMHSACAFLNTEGGWLIFGVAPKSLKILGQQVTDNTQQEIAQALSYMEPQVDVRVEYIDVPDRPNNKVIAMHFEGWAWGMVPYTYHGCPYYKVESTTKEMPRDMYEERLRRSKPDMFAWERQPSEFTDISSLDEKLIRGVVRLGVERGRLSDLALTEPIEDVLGKWKLTTGNKPLNAATALFTKDTGMYTQFTMRLARFQGTDKNEFIDNQRVEGNIFVLLNEAMNFFRKHLNMHGKIVGLVRDEYLEVPAEALREVVLNALCHRQYERYNLTIGIAIYDDRIEIENPGILPPQITPENILQPHISYPYNPLIANVLYSTTYIENWGSGVKRIMEACQKRGVAAPTWTVNGGFVVVTFMRPAKGDTQDGTQNVTQGVTQDVTQDVTQEDSLDGKIEKAIKDNFNVTTEDLAKQFGVTSMTIKRHLAKMSHIRYVGSGYSGHWEVLDKE